MIRAVNITKKFDEVLAVNNVSLEIKEANVFGLIGTNGAGKSTFLRIMAGIIKPDSGVISIDGESVYENIKAKNKFFYISDDQYFFSNYTPKELKNYYKIFYSNFDENRYQHLIKSFGLDENRKIKNFSKGMKKQVSIICGLSAKTNYIFCDETFDGLDPVVRQAVKSLLAQDIEERGLTPIIASHNLRELEDICDNIGLLHKGGVIISKDLGDLKIDLHKIQVVFPKDFNNSLNLNILKEEKRGSLRILTIRGNKEEIINYIESLSPIFYEIMPLSLEEIFIAETEVVGYDIKSLII